MNKPGMNIAKPQAEDKSRFETAKQFAKDTKKAIPNSDTEDVKIENFLCPISLKNEVTLFVANEKTSPNKRFNTKAEFYIQCIRDGLEKYGR